MNDDQKKLKHLNDDEQVQDHEILVINCYSHSQPVANFTLSPIFYSIAHIFHGHNSSDCSIIFKVIFSIFLSPQLTFLHL